MSTASPSQWQEQVKDAEATIHRMLLECLPYGFFSISIKGEKNKKGRVDVLVEGGPSIKHTIQTEEISVSRDSWSGSAHEHVHH